MRKLGIILLGLFVLLIVGCNNQGEQNEEVQFIEVVIQTPDNIEPNESIEIGALVTLGDENVEDAQEVKFEIWEEGQETEHEMIPAKHVGDGLYTITKAFEKDGVYYVVAHVTARDMHNMPRKEVIVGDDQAQKDTTVEQEGQNQGSEGHQHHEHHHGHHNAHGTLVIDFQKEDSIQVEKPTNLIVLITTEDQPLTGANVRFEIWKQDESKHEFIPAEEGNAGEYSLAHVFPKSGIYNIIIHVEKGSLHEHIEKTVEVSN
ncbi:FixH family protein [Cytobacillus suaedae]|nr:FixH family protein [Cytobacillus suaedae]